MRFLERLWYAYHFYEGEPPVVRRVLENGARRFAERGHRLGDPDLLRRSMELRKFDLTNVILARQHAEHRFDHEHLYPTLQNNPDSWIARYLNYVQESEPPMAWQFWSAVAVLGCALRRNLWVQLGVFRPYSAHYIILIGPTGKGKTVAIRSAVDVLERANEIVEQREVEAKREFPAFADIHTKQVKILPTKGSPEFIIKEMTGRLRYDLRLLSEGIHQEVYEDSVGIIPADELSMLVGRDAPGSDRMIVFLTDFYGCPDQKKAGTLSGGGLVLRNVALTLLAGSTAEWIRTEVSPSMFGGGFMGRCIYVPRAEKRKKLAEGEPLDPFTAADLAERLANLMQMRPHAMSLTPDARRWFREWYEECPEPAHQGLLEGYYARRREHLIHLAMVLNVSEHGPFADLDQPTLAWAWDILRAEEAQMPRAFDEFHAHPNEPVYRFIIEKMEQFVQDRHDPWVPHWWLMQKTRHRTGGADQFDTFMRTLIREKRVESAERKRGNAYRLKPAAAIQSKEPQPT